MEVRRGRERGKSRKTGREVDRQNKRNFWVEETKKSPNLRPRDTGFLGKVTHQLVFSEVGSPTPLPRLGLHYRSLCSRNTKLDLAINLKIPCSSNGGQRSNGILLTTINLLYEIHHCQRTDVLRLTITLVYLIRQDLHPSSYQNTHSSSRS